MQEKEFTLQQLKDAFTVLSSLNQQPRSKDDKPITFKDVRNVYAVSKNLQRLKNIVQDYNDWYYESQLGLLPKGKTIERTENGRLPLTPEQEMKIDKAAREKLREKIVFAPYQVPYQGELTTLPISYISVLDGFLFELGFEEEGDVMENKNGIEKEIEKTVSDN